MALSGLTKIFSLQVRLPLVSCARSMISLKNPSYEPVEKPPPFDQDNYDYTFPWIIFDKTTKRFDSNSRIIVLEGAHAVGKTKLAKKLAEEFGMLHMDYPRVESNYFNYYGEDLRNYKEYLSPMNQPYAEKEFFRNPTGPMEGAGDRYMFALYLLKLDQYMMALRHLFNTGQGVILEGNVFQHYAHMEAAYNQGWIDRNTRHFVREAWKCIRRDLPRPHVIIYLDAPVEVVQKKIKDRGNEWDKDSPVWNNKQYLSDIYNEVKRKYLKDQQNHLYVVMYDWSEPGDEEVVVEDIEALELDWADEYSDMQLDWKKRRTEQHMSALRYLFCNTNTRYRITNKTFIPARELLSAEHLWTPADDVQNYHEVFNRVNSMKFSPGYNPFMGDKPLWKLGTTGFKEGLQEQCPAYSLHQFPFMGWEEGLTTLPPKNTA